MDVCLIIPTYNWQFSPQVEDADFTKIAKSAGLSSEVACLLFQRGIKDESSLKKFLDPSLEDLHDPYLLHDMEKAVERIRQAGIRVAKRIFALHSLAFRGEGRSHHAIPSGVSVDCFVRLHYTSSITAIAQRVHHAAGIGFVHETTHHHAECLLWTTMTLNNQTIKS